MRPVAVPGADWGTIPELEAKRPRRVRASLVLRCLYRISLRLPWKTCSNMSWSSSVVRPAAM